jgi:diadenosine tetraphosphate (Ap4A) HIT family hydrolase
MPYDSDNIFAKIIRGEIPSKKVYEDDHVLAFHDAFPKAKVHVLVVPKGEYSSFDDFMSRANSKEIEAFFKTVGKIARDLGLYEEGYRLLVNHRVHAGQEVFHFHMHILGGEPLGPMVCPH